MNNTQARRVDDSHNPNLDSIPTDPVIEGVEKLNDWLEHREIVVEELCPVGALETLYAQRAALYLWRLDRVIGFENAAKIGEIEARSEKSLEDLPESRVNCDSPDRSKLQTIIKYEAHLVRCLSSTMAELRRLQKERRQGFREANPGGRGAERAGDCQNQQINDGSPGGSPSHKSSFSCKITGAEILIPGGGGADRAGVCQYQQIKDGSPGGSPSQTGSPSQKSSPMQSSSQTQSITGAEMSIPGGRGAERAGDCQNQQINDGSPGGSPSQTGSTAQTASPSRKSTTSQKRSTSKKNTTSRSITHTQRASPIPKPPPLLASITNRRRLEEYTLGQTFERNLASATLDFAMIPCS